jgi:hypothetical protein
MGFQVEHILFKMKLMIWDSKFTLCLLNPRRLKELKFLYFFYLNIGSAISEEDPSFTIIQDWGTWLYRFKEWD